MLVAFQADHLYHLHRLAFPFHPWNAFNLQAIDHVTEDVPVAHQAEALENHGNLVPAVFIQVFLTESVDFTVLIHDLAARRFVKHIQHSDHRGFAGAGKADDDKHLASLNLKAYVPERNGDTRFFKNFILGFSLFHQLCGFCFVGGPVQLCQMIHL